MMGPHWNPLATELGIVVEGGGMVKVVCSSNTNQTECRNVRFKVGEGDVFAVPRFYPMAQMSFNNDSFVFMGFSTSTRKNYPQFLAGKRSVLQTLNKYTLALSFNVTNTTIHELLTPQEEAIILDCTSCAEEEQRLMEEEMERERQEEEARKREEEERQREEEEKRREEEEREREEEKRKEEEEAEREREREQGRKREEKERQKREREQMERREREQKEAERRQEEERERREEEPRRQQEEARRQEEEEAAARKQREKEEEEAGEEEHEGGGEKETKAPRKVWDWKF